MKKLFLIVTVLALLAAGCNSAQPAAQDSQSASTPAPASTPPAGSGY